MERFRPPEILLIDSDDHIAQAGAVFFHWVIEQPVFQRRALVEVEAMYHVNDLRAVFSGVFCRQTGHDAHYRLVRPDHVPVAAVNYFLKVAVALAVSGRKRAAHQPHHMDRRDAVQRPVQIVQPAANIGTGQLYGKAVR